MSLRSAEPASLAHRRTPSPATPGLLRSINSRSVLDLLVTHGRLSRSDICAATGVSKPTASALLSRLEGSGRVIRVGTSVGRPGPAAVLYELNPAAGWAAGVDVVPARMHAAVADLTGRVVGECVVRTPRSSAGATARHLRNAIADAVAAAPQAVDLRHVVLGTPGGYDPVTGQLRYAKHLPGWHEPGFLERLRETLGVPVSIENDVNLAALAEQRSGAARGYSDFVLFWAAEGLGAALTFDGVLHRGATGGSGEVGFLPVAGAPLVRWVTRGGAGGFEGLAGAPAVVELGRSHGVGGRTAAEVVARAVRTPGAGASVLDALATRYATGLAAIVAVLDPPVILLSGPVFSAGGEALRERVERELAQLAMTRIPLRLGTVGAPILLGALHAALDVVREAVFATA